MSFPQLAHLNDLMALNHDPGFSMDASQVGHLNVILTDKKRRDSGI